MFTGIVTARGTIGDVKVSETRLRVRIESDLGALERGESVAVNGACLTVAAEGTGWFEADIMGPTRERTCLGDLQKGDTVNLERPLAVGDPLGGHLVQGHVDGVAEVLGVQHDRDALLVDLRLPEEVAAVTILRGSLTIDGVSLTVQAIPEAGIAQVALIPHTREHTTLGRIAPGQRVHVEGDLIGKYVRQVMEARAHVV